MAQSGAFSKAAGAALPPWTRAKLRAAARNLALRIPSINALVVQRDRLTRQNAELMHKLRMQAHPAGRTPAPAGDAAHGAHDPAAPVNHPADDRAALSRDAGAPPPTRSQHFLRGLDRSARIIEIGPCHNPIAPKSDGWNTTTVDHAAREELVRKYAGHPGLDVSRIEEVDCIWTSGPLADAVPSDLHGSFDALIASHVIEHMTDLIGFLDAAETLLAPGGTVILAVPDKRFCFDYFRPLTTTGAVLEAHAAGRSRHSRRTVFEHLAYEATSDGAIAWGQHPVGRLDFHHPLDLAGHAFRTTREDDSAPYVDAHAWQFTPASFELLLLELARLGETDWQSQLTTPAPGCEFHAWLCRGGKAAAAALTPSALADRRIALLKQSLLEAGEQIDFLLAGDGSPDTGLRAAAPAAGAPSR